MSENSSYLFEMLGVTKEFPGVKALDNVTLQVKKGTVHALCGENGAGKSTLMKVLAGIYRQDSGKILIEGREVEIANPRDAMDKGISMIHQELNLFPQMTVEANLYIGRENLYPGGVINKQQNLKEVNAILKEYDIDINPRQRMRELTIANQQMIEIVRAIAFNAKIIIMDEPTRGIDVGAKSEIYAIMTGMAESGKSILMISSEMQELMGMCDRIVVMCAGKQTGIFERSEFNQFKLMACAAGETKEAADRYEN